jgi:hypothetical protein
MDGMNVYQIVFVIVLLLAFVVHLYVKRGKPKSTEDPLLKYPIRERLVKITYNPIVEKWMWTKLNLETHTWEWQREATQDEFIKFEDVVFREREGDLIIATTVDDRSEENHNG